MAHDEIWDMVRRARCDLADRIESLASDFHAAPARGRRLVATDADWARGQGPEVKGRAIDLLLLLANRRQVVPLLEGPGTTGL